MNLPYLNLPWLGASLTPIEAHTPEMKEVLTLSNELVDELLAADHIAISTPVYNYNIPANLKSYVDHIVRKGRTLGATGEGLAHGINVPSCERVRSLLVCRVRNRSPRKHRSF